MAVVQKAFRRFAGRYHCNAALGMEHRNDGQGACLFTKRLERGRFLWPSPADGVVVIISSAQLGYLLSGIDWRNPQETWRPTRRSGDGFALQLPANMILSLCVVAIGIAAIRSCRCACQITFNKLPRRPRKQNRCPLKGS